MQQMINTNNRADAKALANSYIRTNGDKVVICDTRNRGFPPPQHDRAGWNARQQEILNADLIINIVEVCR